MKAELHCNISHKRWDNSLNKVFIYEGDTLDDIVALIDTLPFHRENLKRHRRTAFKDVQGAKHQWRLVIVKDDADSLNRNSLCQDGQKDQKINTASKWKSWLKSLVKSPSKS